MKLRNSPAATPSRQRLRRHTLAESSVSNVKSMTAERSAKKPVKSTSATPAKKAISKSTDATPSKPKGRPRKSKPLVRQQQWAPIDRLLDNLKSFENNENTPEGSGYRLQQVFRMHWRDDANDDIDLTMPDIWKCEFAPPPPQTAVETPYPNQYLLATVGCNSLCITDCQLNRVMFKYCHLVEANETFHSLAWSVLAPDSLADGEVVAMNDWIYVIAVAGDAGTIKLVNLNQTVCYRCLKGHRRSIVDLKFLQSNPRHLLSASDDLSVRLWNIGALTDSSQGPEDWSCISVFTVPDRPLFMAPSPSEERLLVGTVDADICDFDLSSAVNSTEKQRRIKPDRIFDGDYEYWHKSPVDYVAWLDDRTVLSKSSRHEVMVWDYVKSTTKIPFATGLYEWPDFDTSYLAGTTVVDDCRNGKQLTSVSLLGALKSIRVYRHSQPIIKQQQQKSGGVRKHSSRNQVYSEPQPPLMIIENELFEQGFRCVALSRDYRYMVAVDESDCVWIWASN